MHLTEWVQLERLGRGRW